MKKIYIDLKMYGEKLNLLIEEPQFIIIQIPIF